jgi:hypothetical protein
METNNIPFVECRYCEYQCKFRDIAERSAQEDEEFSKSFFVYFRDGDLDELAAHVAEKALEIIESRNPDELLALAFCYFSVLSNILEIPDVLRRKIGRQVKSKVRKEVKLRVEAVPVPAAPKVKVAPPTKAAIESQPAPVVETPAPAVEPPPATEAVEIPSEIEAIPVESIEVEAAPPESAKIEEKPVIVIPEISPIDYVEDWLRSDQEFIYYVDEIVQQGDDVIGVKYDLETEGFLRGVLIKVLNATVDSSGKPIIKLGIKSRTEVPYHLNLIMGKTKKGVVAASLPGEIPSDDDDLLDRLDSIDLGDNIMTWDRLMIVLNRDKFLKRSIEKNIILKSPNESKVPSISVPIMIKKRGPTEGCDLIVQTFLTPRVTPTALLIDVIDGIGEDMDYLLELRPEEREKAPAAPDFFEIKVKPQAGTFSSKFVTHVALPDIPMCPHCNRPLSDLTADYRRCPHCFEKL